MNLVSCDGCGIILNKNKLQFPKIIENPDGSIDVTMADWTGYDYVPFIICPVCSEHILENNTGAQ